MKIIKLSVLVLVELALVVLLTLFIIHRFTGRPAACPAAPPAPVVLPAKPAVAAVKAKKKVRKKIVVQVNDVPIEPKRRHKKRISRLQEPGEALGGGKAARLEADAKKRETKQKELLSP